VRTLQHHLFNRRECLRYSAPRHVIDWLTGGNFFDYGADIAAFISTFILD